MKVTERQEQEARRGETNKEKLFRLIMSLTDEEAEEVSRLFRETQRNEQKANNKKTALHAANTKGGGECFIEKI